MSVVWQVFSDTIFKVTCFFYPSIGHNFLSLTSLYFNFVVNVTCFNINHVFFVHFLVCLKSEDEDDDDSGVRMEEEASEVERELLDGAGELLTSPARVDPSGVIQNGLADILTASVLLMKKPDPGSKACALGILADLFDTIGTSF